MRLPTACLLSGLASTSCTRINAAYGVDDGGVTSGGTAGTSATSTSRGDSTASDSASSATGGHGSDGIVPDAGVTDRACAAVPMLLTPPAIDEVLVDVPILVDLSNFGGPIDAETLHFLGPDTEPLPYERGRGELAWVRVPSIANDTPVELLAVMGPECDVPEASPPSDVWSHGYVAVFHFDRFDAEVFVDSVHGIELTPGKQSSPSNVDWLLGGYVRKTGNDALHATDAALDLSGATPVTTLAWVRLARGEADSLPWVEPNARHREVVTKIPGYRLTAVRGQLEARATDPLPFFNVLETTEPMDQNLVLGSTSVPAATWTMLTGIYDGASLQMYVDEAASMATTVDVDPASNDTGDIRIGRWLHGDLDEIRIASVARSRSWVTVQYASMRGLLIDYGAPKPY